MRRLFASTNRVEIYHLKNLLEAAGVHALIRNEYLHSVAGEIPFTECGIEIWVTRDEELGLAERVFDAWRIPPAAECSAWECTECGEIIEPQFTECWRCAPPSSKSSQS